MVVSCCCSSTNKRHTFGVSLIVCVVILWVGSSELIQCILADFDSPYFLTYFSTCLFSSYLLVYFLRRLYNRHYGVVPLSTVVIVDDDDDSLGDVGEEQLSFSQVARAAMYLCPVWFALNVTFNYSLSRTSLASNTILSATSGVWTLILSRVFLHDPVTFTNVVGVVATVGGAVSVALVDNKSSGGVTCSGVSDSSPQSRTFAGDIWCLVSAMLYGVYTCMLKWWFDDDNRVDMQLVYGLVGVMNMCVFWPGLFFAESFQWPSWRITGYLVLNGVFGTVISDLLWARSVLLTSPIIATLGLTLTIPLAMVVDFFANHKRFHPLYYVGSLLVVAGFVLVNIQHTDNNNDDPSTNNDEDKGLINPSNSEAMYASSTSDSSLVDDTADQAVDSLSVTI